MWNKIDKTKLSRDYEKYPLKRGEKIVRQDLEFLYLELNFSQQELSKLFGKCLDVIAGQIRFFKIKKSREQILKQTFKHNIDKYGAPVMFQTKHFQEKAKKTFLEKYGFTNPVKSERIKQKIKQTCIEKYEEDNIFKTLEFKNNRNFIMLEKYGAKTYCESSFYNKDLEMAKRKANNLKKYGVEHPIQLEDYKQKQKQTCLEKYGVDNIIKAVFVQEQRKQHIEEITSKSYKTKKKNKTFGKSRTEDRIYDLLSLKFNVIRQYKCERYPFACDFYIPEQDLFIEYNGFWTHGTEPFTENSLKHISILKKWKNVIEITTNIKKKKLYQAAITNWTKKDVQKRNIAKQNNLNYLEFFKFKQFESWFNKV